MEIGISFEAGIPVLTLEGRLDGKGAIEFDEQVSALHTDAVQWVIDLSGVGYLSSLGIRPLGTRTAAKGKGRRSRACRPDTACSEGASCVAFRRRVEDRADGSRRY